MHLIRDIKIQFFFLFAGVDGLFNLRRIFAEHPAIGRIVDVCPFNGLQDSEVVTKQGLVIVLESGCYTEKS